MKGEKRLIQLTGYTIDSVLSRSEGRVSYSAYRSTDNASFTVETLDSEYPKRKDVALLHRAGTIATNLSDVSGVRKVHEILPHGSGNIALILAPYKDSLETLLHQCESGLPSIDVVNIAIQLIRTLNEVHKQELIHKAVCPQNIFIDIGNDEVVLAGFDIASELDQERQALQMSRDIEGPLPYISPEQTGRMNRDIDYRTDYYSLGVVMYELITGQHPYQADNLLAWVYMHLSQTPKAPHELFDNIPEVLSNIILKLMAKNPDGRYQSAEGLIHDLELCATSLVKNSRQIKPFVLAKKDLGQKFLLPQKLYGRDKEIATLLALFESTVAGHNELCLVHGYSGVGKSALVNEIDQPLVRERGFLVQSKFQQFQKTEAYSTVAATFRGLVQQILSQTEQELAQWRHALLEALSPNAALVIELVPELALIIGKQEPAATLPPTEARNRLHIVLTAFLNVFAGPEHPVVLFLDDLQWCDTPTLELLRRLVTSHELTHLLIIGAYRSNEVGPGHPLRLLLNDLEGQKTIRQLPLTPLNQSDVNHLVADALHCEQNEAEPLSEILFAKSQGNPFFTNELLRYFHKEDALSFQPENGQWTWNIDTLNWSGVSENVVDFMVKNLRQLPNSTKQVLQLAACIGSQFDIQTLSTIYQHSVSETASALLPALRQHTILPLHSDYRLLKKGMDEHDFNPSYRFQHDRVQQAAYALIDTKHLAEMHLSIGRMMQKYYGEELPDEYVIDIVGHLNQGLSLVNTEDDRCQLAKLNLRAGIRARQTSAYEAAWEYLCIANQRLPSDPWQKMPDLMQSLAQEIQQTAYLTNRTEQADYWIDVMLDRADSKLQRSDILATRTRQYATLGRMNDSIRSAIQGLALLGVEFTDSPTDDDINKEKQNVIDNLGRRTIADLLDAKRVDDPAIQIAMRLCMEIFAAAFLSGSGRLFPYLILKAVNLSLRHGNSPESAFTYAAYGMLLCGELDDPATGFEYAKVGLDINERLDDLTLRARVIYVYAMFVHHWSNHWTSLTPWFNKGIEAGYQSGDLLYLAYSAQDCVIWDPSMDLETAHKLHAENLKIVSDCAYQDSLDSGTLFLQLQRNLLGLTDDAFSLSDSNFDEQQCLQGMQKRQFITGISNYQIYSAELCLLYGDYDRALSYVHKQDKLIKSAMSLPQLVRYYIVAFITLAIQLPKMDKVEQEKTRMRLEHDLARMTRFADNCEANFRHLQLLMQAELKVLDAEVNPLLALECYDLAIDKAKESGFLHDQATAYERAARYLLSIDRIRAAEGYLRAAHHLYERWAAHRKVALLEEEFPVLLELKSVVKTKHQRIALNELDVASVMKASRLISKEIVLDKLLKTTMRILLENAGGQWGCLVIKTDEGLQVEVKEQLIERDISAWPSHSLLKTAEGEMMPLPVTIINEVLHSNEAVVLHDAANEGYFTLDPYIKQYQSSSILCVPIQRERFQGVVYIENNLSSNVFTERQVELIRLLAAQASVAIENARLYEQVQEYTHTLENKVAERTDRLEQLNQELQNLADRDGLTGVANRRRGDEYLKEVWIHLKRDKKPLSVIMLDVDSFKAFNDNYGHQAGDDCLVAVAHVASEQLLRPADLLARYGGEEFLIILPDTDEQGVLEVAEKIRHAIETKAIQHQHSLASKVVTISAGVATAIPLKLEDIDSLINKADKALYQAKRLGRNRVSSVLLTEK